jgi:hypothetical protein
VNWSEQLTRIRRWVRDPDANIFTDNFLMRLFNDEQHRVFSELGLVDTVKVVRTHPAFQDAYLHEWEWPYTGHSGGEVYQAFAYLDAEAAAYTAIWEPEHFKGYDAFTLDVGTQYTQPWEAWMADAPAFPPPIPMPADFHEATLIAYDRRRLEPEDLGSIQDLDPSWRTQRGTPVGYWRHQKNDNWIYLWPLPNLTWADSAEPYTDPLESD